MPKREINIPIGTIVGENTDGTFKVINILDSKTTREVWAAMGKAEPHDKAYEIQLKCGKIYPTLKTQVWKCISQNDVGWRGCYGCKKTCNDSCRWDKPNSHTISVVPKRNTELKIGSIINELKVVDFAFNTKRHNYWEFECEKCGSHIFHMTPSNKSDIENCHCPNCADKNSSKGEAIIEKYLKEYDIKYQRQYKFDKCVYKKPLPFDFAIFYPTTELKCVIEYDGEQHFKFVKHWHGDEEGFKLQQLKDKIKTDYCKNHNIKLIRIPYTEFDNIEQILKNNLII